MTGHEFNPGDVVDARCSDGKWRRAMIGSPSVGIAEAFVVMFPDHSMRYLEGTDVRPLVVIDPENWDQVTQLMGVFWKQRDDAGHGTIEMQAALRSLIAPPKPEEPTGLGAVVEDAEGHQWLRVPGLLNLPWIRVGGGVGAHDYADIAAVRVLSEGWSA